MARNGATAKSRKGFSFRWLLCIFASVLIPAVVYCAYTSHLVFLDDRPRRRQGMLRIVKHQAASVQSAVDSSTEVTTPRPELESPLSAELRAGAVREMISHFWRGYRNKGWGCDEVRPMTGGCGGTWGNLGMTIVDSLDTLWLAGLHDEFLEGEKWIESEFLKDGSRSTGRVSFFETTIRALAGLLSSYALSKHPVLLEKARVIGDRLLHAFDNKPWVASYIDVRNPTNLEATPHWRNSHALADAGSNVLEFSYLSKATGDPRYGDIADKHMRKIMLTAKKSSRQLAPMFLDGSSERFVGNSVSMAACADSYFEYLLKMYLLSGKKDLEALQAWKAAMSEMRSYLVGVSPEQLTYVSTSAFFGSRGGATMDHLSCFVGGSLALGSYYVPKEHAEDWWLPLGIAITTACYETYRRSPTGLGGEVNEFAASIRPTERQYRLRPETLESLFYLWRITGNSTYREWSWKIIQAINRTARTGYGFAKVQDTQSAKSVRLEDSQETFMGAETLKYALLIHLPSEVLPLDNFVFNTEAHPLPVQF